MHINSPNQWPLADIINTNQYYVYRCTWMHMDVYRCIYVSACMHESEFWTPVLCSAQHLLHLPLQHHNTYCTSLSNITTPMPNNTQQLLSQHRWCPGVSRQWSPGGDGDGDGDRRRRRRRQAETVPRILQTQQKLPSLSFLSTLKSSHVRFAQHDRITPFTGNLENMKLWCFACMFVCVCVWQR